MYNTEKGQELGGREGGREPRMLESLSSGRFRFELGSSVRCMCLCQCLHSPGSFHLVGSTGENKHFRRVPRLPLPPPHHIHTHIHNTFIHTHIHNTFIHTHHSQSLYLGSQNPYSEGFSRHP